MYNEFDAKVADKVQMTGRFSVCKMNHQEQLITDQPLRRQGRSRPFREGGGR